MYRQLILLFTVLIPLKSFSQNKIYTNLNIDSISESLGKTVRICAQINEAKYNKNSKETILLVPAQYPKEGIDLVIRDTELKKFRRKLEKTHRWRQVEVKGLVTNKNGYRIYLKKRRQLELINIEFIHIE